MIIVCSSQLTKDVLKALIATKKQKVTATGILQVGDKLYHQLKNNQNSVPEYWSKRPKKYKVNPNTHLLHKKDCKSAKGKLVDASIINIRNTGLKLCKRCML